MGDLARVVKAYDVRGVVPDDLDEDVVRALGRAAAAELGADAVIVGRDVRPTSPTLAEAFAEGVRSRGVDVVDVGLASTDLVYYASGRLGLPAAMITASHNPAEYNGIKLCRAGAEPIAFETGLEAIRDRARAEADAPIAERPGEHRRIDLLEEYAGHVRSFVTSPERLRPLRVAVDAGNGMAAHVVPPVLDPLPVTLVPRCFELDGTFPNHPADPLDPANLADVQAAVVAEGCDVGLAFDGDADRVFAVDEAGAPVAASIVGAVLAEALLRAEPGATVLHNVNCSRVVAEAVVAAGGRPRRVRTGHSYVKAAMAEADALFAVEHSGHYYFRDNYRADSGVIAMVVLLAALSDADGPMSALAAPYDRYAASGERNVAVDDVDAAIARILAEFDGEVDVDRLDGVTLDGGPWWCTVRPSNTEPLLRVNVEAADAAAVEAVLARCFDAIGAASPSR